MPTSQPMIQSSLRDEPFVRHLKPWVETHGYHRMSLRDKNVFGLGRYRRFPQGPAGLAKLRAALPGREITPALKDAKKTP